MTPEDAHAEAIRRIRDAHATGTPFLDLGDLPITAVPDEICILKDHLQVLALGKQKLVWENGYLEWEVDQTRPGKVEEVGPLSGLSALHTLDLLECEDLYDLAPLSALTTLNTLNLSHCIRLADVEPLSGLTALHTLNLSHCDVVLNMEPLSGLVALRTLKLGGTGLGGAEPLWGLTALHTLDLSETGLKDVEALSGLTGLQTLNLSYCKELQDVGPLSGLTALQVLYLGGTGLTDVGPLWGLTALHTLDLSETGLKDVEALSGLTALKTLDLRGTGLSDVEPLLGLTALQTLNLSSCPALSDVGPLSGLTLLHELSLTGTALSDVGPLSGLTTLHKLDLGSTALSDVGPLSGLTALQTLDLNGCRGLRDVGPLTGLTALQNLDLSSCPALSDLGPLSSLTSLQTLGLSFCRDFAFAPVRRLIPTLRTLYLYGADLTDLPTAVGGECFSENVLEAVRAYYDDLGADPEGDAELKVFLLGNGRIGKTKLARRLKDPRDYGADEEPSTHGIQLGRFRLELPGLEHPVWLNLWDFGGQDIYLGSHALFLERQAVFLLLWHPDHEHGKTYSDGGFTIRDRPLAYWFDYLRGLAGTDRNGRRIVESPVILIQSQCESIAAEQPPPVEPPKCDFPSLYRRAYSAKKQRGWAGLQEALGEAVGQLFSHRKQPLIGRGRAEIRAIIREMQSQPEATRKRTISRAEFDQLCERTGGISNSAEFLKFLHRSGVVFYREGVFGDRVVIDQSWALEAVYTVFLRRADLQDAIGFAHGRFTREKLERHVWGPDRRKKKLPPYTIEEQRTFLGLMEKCDICFRVRLEPGQNDEYEYIAPELLPNWDKYRAVRFHDFLKSRHATVTVTLRYHFLHDGVFRGLLSQIGGWAKDLAEYWKFGCWFYDQKTESEVLIQAEPSTDQASGAGTITFRARGTRPRDLLLTLVEVATKLPLGVPPRVDPPDFADHPNRPETTVPNKGIHATYPPRTLFISYRHAESGPLVQELAQILEEVTGDPARVIWDNKLRDDEPISGFMNSVRTIPVLVVVLGPSYLQSTYCLSELFAAWESSECQKDRFRLRVLPLILDDAGIEDVADRGTHARYWSERAKQLGSLAGEFNLGDDDYRIGKQMHGWGKQLGDALAAVADSNLPRGWNAIRADGFAKIRQVLEVRFQLLGVG